jgi:hypothetical protein
MRIARRLYICLFLLVGFPFLAKAQCSQNPSTQFGTVTTVPTTNSSACYYNNYYSPIRLISSNYGGAFTANWPGLINTFSNINIPVSFDPSSAGTYSGSVSATYESTVYTGTYFTITITARGQYAAPGFVNPKYVITSIEYAPPGLSSSASYGNDTVVGNSTSVMSTFSNKATQSVSVSSGGAIPGFTVTRTATESTSYAQEQDTGSSIAVSQMSSLVTGVSGVETPAGTNHDDDLIRVWLNPIATFAVDNTSIPITVIWTGFGYDLNDSQAYPNMELVDVKMGCLNGDINPSDPNCSYFFGRAQRTWAQSNQDGSGPGLTGNGAACISGSRSDICNILAADPFSNPSYAPTFNPPSLTTIDGRYTACHSNTNCTQTVSATPGGFTQYSQGYSTTTTQSETFKYTYTQTFAVEAQFKGTGWANGFNASLAVSNEMSWTHGFSQSTNNSQSQTSSFTIKPSSGYTGPEGFDVYQDNVFGTFIFWPIPK